MEKDNSISLLSLYFLAASILFFFQELLSMNYMASRYWLITTHTEIEEGSKSVTMSQLIKSMNKRYV